ncbi:MAG: IclR family transcriptional regulator [Chloroflexota bacterium]|nr:IclR family transcriptional regulator [Chloroflexota bacterium]
MKTAPPVKTVDRLVGILESFSSEQPTWSLTDLSVHLGLPKSTLHRFLVSLESHGILRRSLDDKRWYLGYRLFIWGSLAAESTDLCRIARPVMRDLMAATGETAILTVYHAQEVICVEKVETSHPVRMTLTVGTRRCPHAGASSKILMAYLPQEEIQAIIQGRGLPQLCANTITDPDDLAAELARIRERGYAESHEETDLGAWGVATPIHGRGGGVVAAIGVAGPRSRFTGDLVQRYVASCHQAAQRISALLSTGVELQGENQT